MNDWYQKPTGAPARMKLAEGAWIEIAGLEAVDVSDLEIEDDGRVLTLTYQGAEIRVVVDNGWGFKDEYEDLKRDYLRYRDLEPRLVP